MRAKLCLTLIAASFALHAVSAPLSGVTAKSAVVLDAESGRVLWSKDPDVARFPASTTKVMTALLLIERCKPDEIITAPADTESVTGSSLYMKPGEQVSAEEMLYAIMLRSANDGCHAVAVHIAGSDLAFADLMNKRAKELGCNNTFFHNPHGLNDDQHKISARDLGIIACEAMKYPRFRTVVRQRKHFIVRSINQEDLLLISRNKWLAADKTADGIKTGYTVPAGHCYVGSATRKGFRVITVLLNSQDWTADHQAMLDWAFQNHDQREIAKAGEDMGPVAVSGGAQNRVPTVLGGGLKMVLPKTSEPTFQKTVELDKDVSAPIRAGQEIGRVVFSDGKGWERSMPLLAAKPVARATLVQRAGSGGWLVMIVLSCFLTGSYIIRRKARRSRKPYGYFKYR
jgi:D-alanyl-D-alanine carboxypeptidase (penicillin-binding protein 5/6)